MGIIKACMVNIYQGGALDAYVRSCLYIFQRSHYFTHGENCQVHVSFIYIDRVCQDGKYDQGILCQTKDCRFFTNSLMLNGIELSHFSHTQT
jgi:hypothetical protein